MFRALSWSAASAAFALAILGSWIRINGAGLTCPDWPLCNGRIIPPLDGAVVLEWSHRMIAFAIGFLILGALVAGWRARKTIAFIRPVTAAIAATFAVQVLLGGATVLLANNPPSVVWHWATAMAFLAELTALAILAWARPQAGAPRARQSGLYAVLGACVVAAFGAMCAGAYVSSSGAGLACLSFPSCDGSWLGTQPGQWAQMLHRGLAGVFAVLATVAVYWSVTTTAGRVRRVAVTGYALVVLQIAIGVGNVVWALPAALREMHAANAALTFVVFTAAFVLATLDGTAPALVSGSFAGDGFQRRDGAGRSIDRRERFVSSTLSRVDGVAQPLAPAGWRGAFGDYYELTKPRIIYLLLITTFAAMMMAARGLPPLWLATCTLVGGALASASAGAFNCVWDRDIDRLMRRTKTRPLAAGRISVSAALTFGVIAGCASFALLLAFVNPLAAWLSVAGNAFYVFVYTMWLKRRTPLNIVIGGAAGAIPPLVGWAAVTGNVGWPAAALFLLIFLWTPPHFWALALMTNIDYDKAGIPMLPNVAGVERTKREIFAYSAVLVLMSLALWPLHVMGPCYFGAAAVLGGIFLVYAWKMFGDDSKRWPRALFKYSLLYLALMCVAMVADRIIALH